MAKQQTPKVVDTLSIKFQATAVSMSADQEQVYLKTFDAPDASGNNDNPAQGGAQLLILSEDAKGFFQSGGEYTFEIKRVVK